MDKSNRKQTFLKSYKAKFSFITNCTSKSELDNKFHAHCTICKADIFIGSGGACDIKRHEKGMKHVKEVERRTCASQPRLNQFMLNREKSQQEKELEEEKKKEKKLKEDVIRAEVKMVEVMAALNLSMNSADVLTKAFKDIFHDSEIAQRYKCSRTKATAIVKELAATHQKLLLERMKTGPFSLSTDGSNDSNAKLFPIVVRTVNPETLKVNAEVVSLPVLEESATGENIFNLMDALLKTYDISWENCVAFGCDNASVMTGVHKGVMSFIKKKNPHCVTSGCTLHLVHIAAEKAAHELPYQPADLLIDIFYYLKKSSVRQRNLGNWQEYHSKDRKKVLKHVATRWLSISRCLDRLVEDWRPLRSFFEEEVKTHTKEGTAAHTKAKSIYAVLCSDTAKLCTLFMKFSVKMFDPFLTGYQADAPMVHELKDGLARLMRDVLVKFVKPTAFAFKGAFDVDFQLAYNQKELCSIALGAEAEKHMKDKSYSKAKKTSFLLSVKKYYLKICTYMKTNLPHDNKFLDKVSWTKLTAEKFGEDEAINHFKYIMFDQPAFIPAGADMDLVISQLSRLQISFHEGKIDKENSRIDEIWAKQAANDPDTKVGCLFLLNCLVVPHSSASCERVFSFVRKIKTDQRSRMGDALLEALIVVKNIPEAPLDRKAHTPEQLQVYKTCCMRALAVAGEEQS